MGIKKIHNAQTLIELVLFVSIMVVMVLYLAPKFATPAQKLFENMRSNMEVTSNNFKEGENNSASDLDFKHNYMSN